MDKKTQIPAAPAGLSARAKKLWAETLRRFELPEDAVAILETAVKNLDEADRARAQIAAEGLVLGGRRHPAADYARQCDLMFLRSMRQLRIDVIDGPQERDEENDDDA